MSVGKLNGEFEVMSISISVKIILILEYFNNLIKCLYFQEIYVNRNGPILFQFKYFDVTLKGSDFLLK